MTPRPGYRVSFHDSRGASYERDVVGADVGEVIAWAEARRGQRTYVLCVCVPHDGLGLVRLAGSDPDAVTPPSSGALDPGAATG